MSDFPEGYGSWTWGELEEFCRGKMSELEAAALQVRTIVKEDGAVVTRQRKQIEDLHHALEEYAEHGSWRCHYRTRYLTCRCGLDELMVSLGLEPVEVQDPEAPRAETQT